MEGYKATILESSKELNVKDRIKFKNLTDAVGIDELSTEKEFNGEDFIINVDSYVVLQIHNEKSENKDYTVYLIIDKDGTVYKTGSESFYTQFVSMFDEMALEDLIDEFAIKVIRQPSKNYTGKTFISCQII